jgi:uncharacterized protein YggE
MRAAGLRFRLGWCRLALAAGLSAIGAVDGAVAQQRAPGARIVVTGEGSVSVAPDVAQIRSGVTTRGKTVREATETNSKTMAAILTALAESGIPQKDVRTAQLSIQPVYAAQDSGKEQKLVGYNVANHVSAKIRHIEKLGDVLDRLIAAGATDVWSVEFLVSEPGKVLDQARDAAVADARRKAEIYAKAAGVTLGRVVSIEEESGASSPGPMRALAQAASATSVPVAPGENTLRALITVSFEIAR